MTLSGGLIKSMALEMDERIIREHTSATVSYLTDALHRAHSEVFAWREAYEALRAYNSSNSGENARRLRAAVARLKKLGLTK